MTSKTKPKKPIDPLVSHHVVLSKAERTEVADLLGVTADDLQPLLASLQGLLTGAKH